MKRYTHYEDFANCDGLTISEDGEWLKYRDVKEKVQELLFLCRNFTAEDIFIEEKDIIEIFGDFEK